MDLGERLSRLSKVRNMNIASLARKSNLSRSTINRVIKNEVSPTIAQIDQMSTALGVAARDMLNPNLAPESFALTGYAILDTLVLNAGRLRAMKKGPDMDALCKETHTPDAKCYSRWYNSLLDRRIDTTAKPPCEIRFPNGYECMMYEHSSIPHLYGLDVKSELDMNSGNVREGNLFAYFPMSAQLSGNKRIQVMTLFQGQGHDPRYNIDEYRLTADIQSILHGKAKPLIRMKLWSHIPTATGYKMSNESIKSYINNK